MEQIQKHKKKASKWLMFLGLAAIVITLVSVLNSNKHLQFELEAADVHKELVDNSHTISMVDVYKETKNIKDAPIIIDLRAPHLFNRFHIENAINLPADILLSEDADKVLSADMKKILVCGTSLKANESWMLLTQYGYTNLFVMEGGMVIYKDYIADYLVGENEILLDEKADHNFAEVIKKVSGNKGLAVKKNSKPMIVVSKKKRKTAEGGCS